jgi:hypothetical protein
LQVQVLPSVPICETNGNSLRKEAEVPTFRTDD